MQDALGRLEVDQLWEYVPHWFVNRTVPFHQMESEESYVPDFTSTFQSPQFKDGAAHIDSNQVAESITTVRKNAVREDAFRRKGLNM